MAGVSPIEDLTKTLLSKLDFSISNIYFKFFSVQLEQDTISIPNVIQRYGRQCIQSSSIEDHDEEQNKRTILRSKYIIIFRDKYFISNANITGIIVYLIKKENRMIMGLDDGTGITNCILWTNYFTPEEKDNLSNYFRENSIEVGSSVNVLGQLESYNGQVQISIKNIKIMDDSQNDLHQFNYSAVQVQKSMFDPFSRPEQEPYFRNLSCLKDINNKEVILEELKVINKDHEDFIVKDPKTTMTDSDISRWKEQETKSLMKIAELDSDLVDMIIQNRTEGPLTADSIKYGHPSIMDSLKDTSTISDYLSKQIIIYSEPVMIQKLTNILLSTIPQILSEIPKSHVYKSNIGEHQYTCYRLKLLADFISNPLIKNTIEEFQREKLELSSYNYKEIALKCINEFQNEKFILREKETENIDLSKEETVIFVDKRQEFKNYLYEMIQKTGDTGIKEIEIFNKVSSEFSKFYNQEYIKKVFSILYEEGLTMENDNRYYAQNAF
ncbi:unnamed protein product [Moneuplotes crassus]|uniref:Uncharacterized protein n=1 Tax=Euplotes crassus TaxID=5936 RepID=A0AAD1XDN5_EUPCR|nr:unnamed protein product [Moneuplotes crassus]